MLYHLSYLARTLSHVSTPTVALGLTDVRPYCWRGRRDLNPRSPE
ncbi:protein of unknown function [Candidatus Bipolaricaulis anaerobius]|uniref:Uncharacterized protein n=1 Tax=Candidatus Bipolaricaulis anaerobius TaxID=2026885 RepID=A0A2X3K4M2_9BACT|nr:protein of unknown function [Candidatus Bipolaricaulis anaerobius]